MRGRVGGIRQSRSPLGNIVATRRQCSSARGGECGLRKEAPAPLDRVNEDGGRNTAREGTCTVQGVPSELRLGFVDLDFECSTVFPTLLGLMGIWQKRLGSWVRWWNTEIKVSPTHVSAHLGHPVVAPSEEAASGESAEGEEKEAV